MAKVKNKAANAQFKAAADRIRRRPRNFTNAINRAERNARRLGSDRRISSAADRLQDRPTGLTSAIHRARDNGNAARRRIR